MEKKGGGEREREEREQAEDGLVISELEMSGRRILSYQESDIAPRYEWNTGCASREEEHE